MGAASLLVYGNFCEACDSSVLAFVTIFYLWTQKINLFLRTTWFLEQFGKKHHKDIEDDLVEVG